MDFEGRTNQKNHHKIPHGPPFPKGETMISSLCKREVGRDFQNAKVLPKSKIPVYRNRRESEVLGLGF